MFLLGGWLSITCILVSEIDGLCVAGELPPVYPFSFCCCSVPHSSFGVGRGKAGMHDGGLLHTTLTLSRISSRRKSFVEEN